VNRCGFGIARGSRRMARVMQAGITELGHLLIPSVEQAGW